MSLPNIQTSLAVVNRRKFIDSGAIHLIGNLPLDAVIAYNKTLTQRHSSFTQQLQITVAVFACKIRKNIEITNALPL